METLDRRAAIRGVESEFVAEAVHPLAETSAAIGEMYCFDATVC